MKEDKKLFQELSEKLPKDAYKQVKFGRGFTTIDAYHVVAKMTSVFGLCGKGWGFGELEFRHEKDNVACIGSIWYEIEEKRYQVQAVGDAQILKGNVAEAFKKAQTNLLSKASSYLGIGLSVYQGKGLDDPYLDRAEMKKERRPVAVHEHGLVSADSIQRESYVYDVSSLENSEDFQTWYEGLKDKPAIDFQEDKMVLISDKPIKKLKRYLEAA